MNWNKGGETLQSNEELHEEIEQLMKDKNIDREAAYRIIQERPISREAEKTHGMRTENPKSTMEKFREEERALLDYQENKSLLVEIIKEVQKNVAGEEDTILAITIVAMTRLVENAIPESTNLLLSDKTGLGKDHTVKNTLKVILPSCHNQHVTKMTPEAFTYWHQKEDDWTWDRKVIHFEDITQQLLNCPTFKVMASGDSRAVVVKDQKTIEIPIKGKPCMILTSHHANPADEALRRFRIGGLNDTEEQTRKILEKISSSYTGIETIEPNVPLRKAVQDLKSKKVVIPIAPIIQHFFPSTPLMRTHYRCFLDYIAASAVLHQHQRETTKEGELIATPDDYMVARMVLIYTTSNAKLIPTSREYREIIEILKNHIDPMTIADLEEKSAKSQRWLYNHLPRMTQNGLLIRRLILLESANKKVMHYQYDPDLNVEAIPTWDEIITEIMQTVNKTDKTNKTEASQRLEKWFCTHDAKLTKPDDTENGCSLVLHGLAIPLNREVLPVFTVLHGFLKERGKRFEKYYKNTKNGMRESFPKPSFDPLDDEVQSIKNLIISLKSKTGIPPTKVVLMHNGFEESFIDELSRRGEIIQLPNEVGGYSYQNR